MIRKLRAQKISIDLPTETATPWVNVIWQLVRKDAATYVTVQTIDRVDESAKPLMAFAMEAKTVSDPVTGQDITVSGAGMAELIKAFVSDWIMAENPGSFINEHGDIIAP
jgi:hypothetical protein